MRSDRLRLLIVAEESAGIQLLRALLETDHDIVSVVCSETEEKGTSSVFHVARTMDIPRIPARLIPTEGFADEIRDLEPDLLLNVHSLHILPEDVLGVSRLGAYNLHPGPLPEMAGLNVPSWAIFEGRDRHGVTVHRMETGIDTGAIAYEERFDIGTDETALSLMSCCVRKGIPLALHVVTDAETGRGIPAKEQDPASRGYYGGEVPNGGWIDWTWPAERIDAFVRACDYGPFPSPWGRPKIAAQDGDVLEVTAVTVEGRCEPAELGLVTGLESGGIVVGAGTGSVRVMRIRKDGRAMEPGNLFRTGDRMRFPTSEGRP